MIPIQYAAILLLAISWTNAALLNEACTNNTQCQFTGGVCPANKCQCNTPFYKPCNTSCEVVGQFEYEGGKCEAPENCIGNTQCQGNKCQCNLGYVPKNGVCFKNLTSNCRNDSECWSEYCFQSVCQCPAGYKAVDGTTCERKLVEVYNNWAEASQTNSFCLDAFSCFDIIAQCYTDPAHPQWKFCKCPDGYNIEVIDNHRRCQAIRGQNLSPFDNGIPANYVECGQCEDDNAVCIQATGTRTCWCRAGYRKNGNKCESRGKSQIIFPNSRDLQTSDFTVGCSQNISAPDRIGNRLCVCAPGYTFEPKDRSCKKIELQWINASLEYGLCTQINSEDTATAVNEVCPAPLQCLARDDKHICSCGKDKFQDLDDASQCVYFIGKGANASDRRCPANTRAGTTDNCACNDGYAEAVDRKGCEVKLSPTNFDGSCNASLTSLSICGQFGKEAKLCSIGSCRCSAANSFPNPGNTHCYSLLNTPLTTPTEDCPTNSTLISNVCTCIPGSHPSGDLHECVLWDVPIVAYQGPPQTTNGGLTTQDCKVFFSGPVEAYDNAYCQCQSDAMVNENNNGCRYKLNVVLPSNLEGAYCPLNTDYTSGQQCVCKSGYKEVNNLCVPITDQVYSYDDINGRNISGVNDGICLALYGRAAIKSIHGDYCACKQAAYPVRNNQHCHYLINVTTDEFKGDDDCPSNSAQYPLTRLSACICNTGYRISVDNRTCEPAKIPLVGSDIIDMSNNCTAFTNDDCVALYGTEAFCKANQCYCNRRTSFMNNQKCESFTSYKFPGEHELYLYTCQDDDDCDGKGNVTCDYTSASRNYKVCTCQDGSYLNPKTQTCEDNRCMGCNTALGFECRDYICQCKSGLVQVGGECVPPADKLQLYQPCNRTIYRDTSAAQSLVCDVNCNHARCNAGYRAEGNECVRYALQDDRCVHRDNNFCKGINPNAECDREENRCLCGASYYLEENQCFRAVGFSCTEDEQCGRGECKAKQCACKNGQRAENTKDRFNRPLQRCINGMDQIRSNSVLLFLFLLAYVLFK